MGLISFEMVDYDKYYLCHLFINLNKLMIHNILDIMND
jgi:hypothetical protein